MSEAEGAKQRMGTMGAASFGIDLPDVNLADLEGAFSGSTIDQLSVCTLSQSQYCDIIEHLSVCNELLLEAGLALRQHEASGGLISVVVTDSTYMLTAEKPKLHKCATLIYWLLKGHRCVHTVDLTNKGLVEYEYIVLEALRCNPFVKALNITPTKKGDERRPLSFLSSLRSLRKLECDFCGLCPAYVPHALADFLRTTTSLTSLSIPETLMENPEANVFLDAIVENTTLEELHLHGSVLLNASGSYRLAFREYLLSSRKLTALSLNDEVRMDKDILMLVVRCLLINRSLTKVGLWKVDVDAECAKAVEEVLSKNDVLQLFHMTEMLAKTQTLHEMVFGCWVPALCANRTIEEFRIPVSAWNPRQWRTLLNTIATISNMKKLIIEFVRAEYEYVRLVYDIVAASGAGSKVRFVPSLGPLEPGRPWDESLQFQAWLLTGNHKRLAKCFPCLPSFSHVTSACIEVLPSLVDETTSVIASCIRTTRTLKKLHLFTLHAFCRSDVATKFWTDVNEALNQNRSLRELVMSPLYANESTIERIAKTCRSSQNIHALRVLFLHGSAIATAFIRTFSTDLTSNYTILRVAFSALRGKDVCKNVFAAEDTARRNSALVYRAADFVSGVRRNRYGAQALDRVGRHAALPEHVARLASVSEAEAVSMIRTATLGLRNMHDFMRLAGVVQEHVVCLAREDCRPQLDSLDEYSWSLIRRYLFLDEIVTPRQDQSVD